MNNDIISFLQGMSNSAAGTVTAPVDGIAWLLRKAGVPVPAAPVGGSDWMEQKGLLAQPKSRNAGLLGEAIGGVTPIVAAAKAPQIARGLLQMGENAAKPSTLRNVSQRGIFGGELAQTADKAALSKAKELEKAGAEQRAIWKETGWFKGGDGKWRFEIDDAGFKVSNYRSTGGGMAPDHPGLKEAYPNSHRLKITPDARLESGTMGYAPWKDSLDFRMGDHGAIVYKPGESAPDDAWLHELQHYVQAREGFANGGAPSQMKDIALEMLRRDVASGQIPDTAQAMQMLPMAQHNAYKRLAGEAEARAVQSRMNLTPAQRRALFPLDSYDVPLDSLIYR